MRLRIFRIELERDPVLFDRFFQLPLFLQCRSVIKMRFGACRHIGDHPRLALHFGNSDMCLPKPERA